MELPESTIAAPVYKIYKERDFRLGTFIGGPLVSAYMMAANFKAFNENDKVARTWIYSIIATIVIFCGAFLISGTDKLSTPILPLLYIGVVDYFVKRLQGTKIAGHIVAGGKTYPWGRAVCIGLISIAIMAGPLFAIAYAVTPSVNYSTKTYGKLKHEIVFDEKNISAKEVDQFGYALMTVGVFNDELQKESVFLKTEKNQYVLVFPVKDSAWKKADVDSAFVQIRIELQKSFPKNKVAIALSSETDINDIKNRFE